MPVLERVVQLAEQLLMLAVRLEGGEAVAAPNTTLRQYRYIQYIYQFIYLNYQHFYPSIYLSIHLQAPPQDPDPGVDPADGAAGDLAEAGAGGGQEAADLPLRGHAGAGLQEGQAGPHLTRATLATKGCYSNFSGTIHLLLYYRLFGYQVRIKRVVRV